MFMMECLRKELVTRGETKQARSSVTFVTIALALHSQKLASIHHPNRLASSRRLRKVNTHTHT